MPIAGHRAAVKVSGDATPMTDEACTSLAANKYQVTSTAKRILDPDTALTVKDNAVPLAVGDYTVNYLFGIVTKASGNFTGPVTISGKYLSVLTIAEGVSVSISSQRAELETTVFGDTDRKYMPGLKHAEGEIEGLALPTDDLDPGAQVVTLDALRDNGTRKLLDVTLDPDAPKYWRGWVLFPGLDQVAKFDELVKTTVKWKTTSVLSVGEAEYTTCGVGS